LNTYCLCHFIAMSVFVSLLVLCSCNSVRMSLKSIISNLLTYLRTYLLSIFSAVCAIDDGKLRWPWNPGSGWAKVIETTQVNSLCVISYESFIVPRPYRVGYRLCDIAFDRSTIAPFCYPSLYLTPRRTHSIYSSLESPWSTS